MAKVPVRVLQSFKGLAVGATTSMSIGRAREAAARGEVEVVGSNKKPAKAAKKVAKKAPAKKAAKAVGRTRTTSMRGKTQVK